MYSLHTVTQSLTDGRCIFLHWDISTVPPAFASSVEETEKRLKAEKEKKANEEQDKIDKQLQKEADEER